MAHRIFSIDEFYVVQSTSRKKKNVKGKVGHVQTGGCIYSNSTYEAEPFT